MKFLKMKSASETVNSDTQVDNVPSDARRGLLLYLRDLVCLLAGIVLVFSLLFRVVVVSGPSMNDTLVDGDWILLLGRVFYGEPEQGDIIVASKDSFKEGEPIIKRVIAVAGQKVDIDFTSGTVYVDDQPLDEAYTLTPTNLNGGTKFPLIVDNGCVFVMGDNRNRSQDSRSLEIGQIDCREILGKAIFLMFPGADSNHPSRDFNRIGALS